MFRPRPSLSSSCAWVAVIGLAAGCATARNYDDPAAPIYTGGPSSEAPLADVLRIVTFNLKFGKQVGAAIELLSREPLRDADLLVMEEMDLPATQGLAEALGLAYVYVPSAVHPQPKQDFGVALFSRWRLEAPYKIPLPHEDRFQHLRRAAVGATLHSPLGPIRVYGLHLESPTGASGSVRRDQARTVVKDAEGWTGPVVIAGDFNGRGGAHEIADAGFFWATESIRKTAGPFTFDHVLARGLCAAGPHAVGKVEDSGKTSDHHPVWALLAPCPARAGALFSGS